MSLTPSPRLHSASHSRPPSPGKHARDASTFAADARDDSDSKRIKVEPGESEGTGPDGVTAPKLSIDTERAVRPSASGPSHPQSSASLLSTSHAITTPPPHLHSYSASSHSHSRSSPAPHEPTSTSAASARITKSHTPGRDDANAHESDSSAAATPSAGRASAAVSPERKVPKDKSNLHKAAVANKKRKDKPQSKKKTERPENEKPESKDRKRTKSKHDKTPEDEEDETIHCICKGANQEDDTFIGCEICDGWFHPTCVGINEESVEMLDVYVCPPCESTTGRTTVYKRPCKRDGCEKTARSTSKYCSSKCAFQSAQSVLATVEKKELGALEASLAGYPSPSPSVTMETHAPTGENGIRDEDGPASLIATLQAQKEDVARLAELVSQRQALFAQAIAQWDALKPVATNNPVPAPKRKSKTKRREGETTVERPCGWDSRLMWSDDEVRSWYVQGQPTDGDVEMAEEGGEEVPKLLPTMCPASRRCERHQGWQKTLGVALDVEAAQLSRKKDELDALTERLVRLEEVESAGAKAKTEVHARLQRK